MVDIGTIGAAVSGLNTARELLQALVGIRDATVLNQKVLELQGVILTAQGSALDAQAEQLALLRRVSQLEEQVASFEAWDTEKEKYELKEIRPGIVAYSRKEGAQPTEPAHYICADCYQQRQKFILQRITKNPGRAHVLACNHCGCEIYESGQWQPEHGARRRGR